MSTTRVRTFTTEIRRIRAGISRLVGDEPAPGGDAPRAAVRSHLAIRDVMQGQLSTVRPESPLGAAVTMMIEQRVSSLPVVDAEGRIVGALNEKDILKVFYEPDATTVAMVMTTDPIVMAIDAPLADVVDQLMSSDFRRVLIHDGGRLVGVVVRTHLMPAVLLALEELALSRARSPERPH